MSKLRRLIRRSFSTNASETYDRLVLSTENLSTVIAAMSSGTTLLVQAGTYRFGSTHTDLKLKNGMRLSGQPGAVLSGAQVLSSPTFDGTYWYYDNQTQENSSVGECLSTSGFCDKTEDVYYDDRPFTQSTSLAALSSGHFFFDHTADRIYIKDDPTGHVVETNVAPRLVASTAAAVRVTVTGFTIEKFANPAQTGALDGSASSNWTISSNTIRLNHGIGLRIGHNMTVTRNRICDNGQMGMGGIGNDVVVSTNTISSNNYAGFYPGWEGGGTKFVQTTRLTLRDNTVNDNLGPGIWLDINNDDYTISSNTCNDNDSSNATAAGILIEVSGAGTIRDNTCLRNGLSWTDWIWNGGILISASGRPDVNTIISSNNIGGAAGEENQHGISLIQQHRNEAIIVPTVYGSTQHLVYNIKVRQNTVRVKAGGQVGAVRDSTGAEVFDSSRGNVFSSNTYFTKTNANHFAWADAGDRPFVAEWQGVYGMDTSGSATVY